MKDITVIFITINKVPKKWAEFHKKVLLEAVADAPLISVTAEPSDLGTNIIQTPPFSTANIYDQILRASKMATTPYIGIAEDDVLYPKEHFHTFRPALDAFAYNLIRWQLHTWEPVYYWRERLANYAMIAPRELTIKALEERLAKCSKDLLARKNGELGRYTVEHRLGVTLRNSVQFKTTVGLVCLHHDFGLDPLERNHKKRMGFLRAYDIPHWGRSEDLVRKFI